MRFTDGSIVVIFDQEVWVFILNEIYKQHDLHTRSNTYGYAVTPEKYRINFNNVYVTETVMVHIHSLIPTGVHHVFG